MGRRDGETKPVGDEMKPFWEIADFLRTIRRQMRFGDLSRAPLQLVRLEWQGDTAQCDWIVRPPDAWDENLGRHERERNVSEQALRDAIQVCDLLFAELPSVKIAVLRAFRQSETCQSPALVIAGTVRRGEEGGLKGIRSSAMRVKLCGLQFRMDDGRLEPLQMEV
jgi:hypothetical protein